MDINISSILFSLIILVGLLPSLTDGLRCFQCNVWVRGTPWRCDDDIRGMGEKDDCVGCLKTYTRSYLHNTFHDQILTDWTSRLCMRSKDYDRPDGCYPHETDGGYQKYCYCHTDLCNAGYNHRVTLGTTILVTAVTVVLRYFL